MPERYLALRKTGYYTCKLTPGRALPGTAVQVSSRPGFFDLSGSDTVGTRCEVL